MRKKPNPVLKGESKAFRIRFSRSGMRHVCMSSVVRIKDSRGVGVSKITFSEELVNTIGKHMPRGAGPDDPVFLRAEENLDGTWHILSQYIHKGTAILLWVTEETPSWLREIRRFDRRLDER